MYILSYIYIITFSASRSITWAAIIMNNSVRFELQKAGTMKCTPNSLFTTVMFLENPTNGETVTCEVKTFWKNWIGETKDRQRDDTKSIND